MCLTFFTETEDYNSAVQIAEKDITVYKIVEKVGDTYYSEYVGWKYLIGKAYKKNEDWPLDDVYTMPMNLEHEYLHSIYDGYHAYVDLEKAKRWFGEEVGYATNGDRLCIVECHIPAGAKYVVGYRYGDIVSSAIVIDKEIECYGEKWV